MRNQPACQVGLGSARQGVREGSYRFQTLPSLHLDDSQRALARTNLRQIMRSSVETAHSGQDSRMKRRVLRISNFHMRRGPERERILREEQEPEGLNRTSEPDDHNHRGITRGKSRPSRNVPWSPPIPSRRHVDERVGGSVEAPNLKAIKPWLTVATLGRVEESAVIGDRLQVCRVWAQVPSERRVSTRT